MLLVAATDALTPPKVAAFPPSGLVIYPAPLVNWLLFVGIEEASALVANVARILSMALSLPVNAIANSPRVFSVSGAEATKSAILVSITDEVS